jgi:iron complex outermembrane receptor protein
MGRIGLLFAGASMLAYASPALAQEAVDEDGADQTDNVIVVTAQKREQDIIEVPVAVSAFSDTALQAANVNDFADITRLSPSLTINGAANNNEATIALRGIGTFSFSTSVEPSVSVVIDDVAVVQQGQAFSNLADIGRIEVLRGPQGNLFGKNASAGVINIVTKAPSADFTGNVEGVLTDDGETRVSAMLSGPISDSVGFRINGYYVDRDGYIDNLQTGNSLNGEEGFGLRGKLVAEIGAAEITLIADHSQRDVLGNAATFLRLPTDARFFGNAFDRTGIEIGLGANTIRFDRDPIANNEQTSLTGKMDLDLGFATLTSVTGYQEWNYDFGQDVDGTSLPLIFQTGPYAAQQFSQELRLTSPSADGFEYMFGLFYADASTDRAFVRGPLAVANWDSTASTTSYAAFAQLSYDLGPYTSLIGGGRLNHEEIAVRFEDRAPRVPVTFVGADSDTAATWRVALQHFVAPEVNLFASVATGYKGQAYDVSTGFTLRRAQNPVAAETSVSYEVGMKGRVIDDRLSFALTGFWTDYNDFQAQSAVVTPTEGILVELNNVGRLRTRGVEFEGSFEITEAFDIFASAAYTDARIREFTGAQCYAGQTAALGCVFNVALGRNIQNLSGARLANSPEFKYTVGAAYEAPLGGSSLAAFANANYNWQSDVTYDLFGNPLTQQDSYSLVNLNIGIKDDANDRWTLTAFVNNLFDVQYAAGIIDNRNFFGGSVVLTQQLARNFARFAGVRLKIGF